jgi:hypothetical protein
MNVNDFIYFEYEGEMYRKIELNGKWHWFKQIEVYSQMFRRFVKQWSSFTPNEKMEKIYQRQKKLDRLFNDEI